MNYTHIIVCRISFREREGGGPGISLSQPKCPPSASCTCTYVVLVSPPVALDSHTCKRFCIKHLTSTLSSSGHATGMGHGNFSVASFLILCVWYMQSTNYLVRHACIVCSEHTCMHTVLSLTCMVLSKMYTSLCLPVREWFSSRISGRVACTNKLNSLQGDPGLV